MFYQNKVSIAAKVFNSMGRGVLVTDEYDKVTDINPRFTEITGYTAEGNHKQKKRKRCR